jgi:hypothetical protein
MTGTGTRKRPLVPSAYPPIGRDDRLRAAMLQQSARLRVLTAILCRPRPGGHDEADDAKLMRSIESAAKEISRAVSEYNSTEGGRDGKA